MILLGFFLKTFYGIAAVSNQYSHDCSKVGNLSLLSVVYLVKERSAGAFHRGKLDVYKLKNAENHCMRIVHLDFVFSIQDRDCSKERTEKNACSKTTFESVAFE